MQTKKAVLSNKSESQQHEKDRIYIFFFLCIRYKTSPNFIYWV